MNQKSEKVTKVPAGPLPEVVEVDANLRIDLMLAYARRRAARAELGEAQQKVERLIAKLDREGELTKAIASAAALVAAFNEAELRLNASLSAVQNAAGVNLVGYVIDPDKGTLRKPPAPAGAPMPADSMAHLRGVTVDRSREYLDLYEDEAPAPGLKKAKRRK